MAITSGYTEGEWATDGHKFILFTGSSAQTYTLPDAGHLHFLTVKLVGTGAVTINTVNNQTIDGAATSSLSAQYAKATLLSDGHNWFIVG